MFVKYLTIAVAVALCAAPAFAQTPANSSTLFAPCKVCHSINKGGKNGLGPALNGVVGRKAGSVAAFNYSPAMKAYGKTWTPALLDAYLANPRAVVPGNRMTYPGLKDATKRAALIQWIKTQ